MESPETLAIESFSRSWLTSVNPSLQGLETALGASLDSSYGAISEEFDYRMQNSRRSLEEDQNFNFYFPISQSPDALLHADQLFSDGLIRPIFINQSKNEASSSLNLAPNVPSSLSSKTVSAVQILCRFLGRWKRILPKCFGYVRPLSHRVRDSRISTRVDNVERIAWEAKSQSNSREASPSRRVAYSLDGCHDSERSIHDAVLHCKRSMRMCMPSLIIFLIFVFVGSNLRSVLILFYFYFQINDCFTHRRKNRPEGEGKCRASRNAGQEIKHELSSAISVFYSFACLYIHVSIQDGNFSLLLSCEKFDK
ncbi:hypothetical protein POTOM_048066 [Populus tomentosa]|uniref:Membrane-associated kinase regulator 6 n=1 Tax=Populus tomentosa TaxID=118781 RepID=A0A8X7YND0_POPTO|nr:hypothetical protein POTOM_048066 [Populus tomentosa]